MYKRLSGMLAAFALGDINLFDIFLLKTKGTQLGVGPLVTFPSANEDELGTDKWPRVVRLLSLLRAA